MPSRRRYLPQSGARIGGCGRGGVSGQESALAFNAANACDRTPTRKLAANYENSNRIQMENHPRWGMKGDRIPGMLDVGPHGPFDVGLPPGKESPS
jgi:hypothetical protein